jgi:hypothetical protein
VEQNDTGILFTFVESESSTALISQLKDISGSVDEGTFSAESLHVAGGHAPCVYTLVGGALVAE